MHLRLTLCRRGLFTIFLETMPGGRSGNPMLSLQDAWDVAAFINSQERPQDPRFSSNLAETKKKYHDHQCYYGETWWGKALGATGR